MDTLTHALLGALLGRATQPRIAGPHVLPVGRRMLVGAAAAAFPDLDFITSYLSPLSYLHYHRGITHSLLLLPVWALLVASIFAAIWRWKLPWQAYLGVAALGLASHVASDLITAFGTMIFAPYSDARYALSATFIIDLWFTGIILAGLVAGALWRTSRAPAVSGVVVLVGYVALQVVLQGRAIDFGEAYARDAGIAPATVTAMPRPVSPFNWTVFVADEVNYRYAHVNLARETAPPPPDRETGFLARLDAAYRPLADARWVRVERYGANDEKAALARAAYTQPGFRFFRWFAAYPALLEVASGCAWFHDLRFMTPGRDTIPFRYGMCQGENGAWQPYQLVGSEKKAVY